MPGLVMDHKPPEIAGQATQEPIDTVSEDVAAPEAKQSLPNKQSLSHEQSFSHQNGEQLKERVQPLKPGVSLIPGQLTASHWGTYRVDDSGAFKAFERDPKPCSIGLHMREAYRHPLRIARPAARHAWLIAAREGRFQSPLASGTAARGEDRFVELDWPEACSLAASALQHTKKHYGNEAIFGGSYGWSSAGRFHHAQSQVHRFLNAFGGYVRSVDTYSLGAGRVILPHVFLPIDRLIVEHHDWKTLQRHTKLFVSFGGAAAKNAQIGQGGASLHQLPDGLQDMAQAGCRFVNISPVRDDIAIDAWDGLTGRTQSKHEWLPIRPNTDTAMMLALSTEIILAGKADLYFLDRYTVGFSAWKDYLLGKVDGQRKDASWASLICDIPSTEIRGLAQALTSQRSLINVAWSLQRASHGEQSFWAAIGLASVIGQIGLPGGGVALAYGPSNVMGSTGPMLGGPTLPQGINQVKDFIPVARIADALMQPKESYRYNGETRRYPDLKLLYWAGGNPFHHHQDLNRLARAWQRPNTIIIHEQFWNANAKMADLVMPATTTLERDDIGYAHRDPHLIWMSAIEAAYRDARDDYEIFSDIAALLGVHEDFTEHRSSRQWLEALYDRQAKSLAQRGLNLPSFEQFCSGGGLRIELDEQAQVLLAAFRDDPANNPLATPSGRIEISSQTIEGFSLPDCGPYPRWIEPFEYLSSNTTITTSHAASQDLHSHASGAIQSAADQVDLAWLKSSSMWQEAMRHPALHLISDQPATKLHSQLDHAGLSRAAKRNDREPIMMHPDDAASRQLKEGDILCIMNQRGACLASLMIDDGIRPGVIRLSTGAWWDPAEAYPGLCLHGNPNALTADRGASSLSQGCSAQSCLVWLSAWTKEVPPMKAFETPRFIQTI